MGRRKRQTQKYRPANVAPKIFECPKCGKKTMKAPVSRSKEFVIVTCGHCGTEEKIKRNALTEPVDAYGDFIDIYYKDREYDRLLSRVEMLWEKEQYTELTLAYSFLHDIALINKQKALEAYEKSKDPVDLENSEKWNEVAEEYASQREQLLQSLKLGELVDADIDDGVYDTKEINPFNEDSQDSTKSKPKRRRNIEEILGDTGFLEF